MVPIYSLKNSFHQISGWYFETIIKDNIKQKLLSVSIWHLPSKLTLVFLPLPKLWSYKDFFHRWGNNIFGCWTIKVIRTYAYSKITGCKVKYNQKQSEESNLNFKFDKIDAFGCASKCLMDITCTKGWSYNEANQRVSLLLILIW